MKKTLLVTIDFAPSLGGVASYLKHICSSLPKDDLFVLAQEHPKAASFDSTVDYKIIRKNLFFSIVWPKWVKGVFEIYKIVKRHGVEQILVGQLLPVGSMAYLLHKLTGIPYIVQTYGMDLMQAAKHPRKKRLARSILQSAKQIIVNSESTRDELYTLMGKKVDSIMIYPIPELPPEVHQADADAVRASLGLTNEPVLLHVGRLVKRKGLDHVIKAMDAVWQDIPDMRLVVIGDGIYANDLKKLAHDKRIIFLGKKSKEELYAWYKACEIFIMTPRKLDDDIEGFGIVYLEAHSFKKPVISGSSGGEKEAVLDNETGLVVDGEDIGAISSAIVRLAKDEQLRIRLGTAGKERLSTEFNWRNIIKALIDIL